MTLLVCTLAIPLALGGCGGTRKAASICRRSAQQLVAHALGLSPNRVAASVSKGHNLMPQCTFKASSASGGRLEVTINVDTSPQPYAVLARTIEERQQVFSPSRLVAAPITVLHLGLLASWFPDDGQLMSTDGVRLVTTTVHWPGTKQRQEIRFATEVSRLYLGKSRPDLATVSP